ncbi:SET and MYND domain-containing protein DDB_G0273589-like [Sitodiplosis mosellana]|uniref:SET and MYND domain-containing protein DDB_G0273589-like n=1 Tax=Sitodiplosis mosellana TaxID=263140 RepID=UPI002443A333|nr:SET and MYND domain-containing protein DDB_G0273589-like [Sitodiplosis mosellana]
MLWQKETAHQSSLYIDLCQSLPNHSKRVDEMYEKVQASLETNKVFYVKSDEVAEEYWRRGNKKYGEKNWTEALENWNLSLCFAQKQSIFLGLAYGNRSSYFLTMKMFKNCLIDIELAIKNHYPPKMLAGLNKLKNKCVQSMRTEKDQSDSLHTHLDFEANANFSSLACMVEILYNSEYGRHIVATDDIEVGKTVMVEQSYLGESVREKYKTCIICLRTRRNLKPCLQCTKAMFCLDCEKSDLHRADCNFHLGPFATFLDTSLVRSIWMAKNAFQNVNQLITIIEKMLANQPLPPLSERQSKYQSFFNLCTNQNSEIKAQMIYLMHQKILKQPSMPTFFKTKGQKRFLMHLIYHHMMIIRNTTQTIRCRSIEGKQYIKSHQLSITASYFNHSCVPNVCIIHANGFINCVTIRPIRRNEQLFVTYIDNIDEMFPGKEDRQKVLQTRYNFQCDCALCTMNVASISMKQLQVDADYKFIQSMFNTDSLAKGLYNRQQIELMKDKCCSFLTKNGWCVWSAETRHIAKVFCHLIRRLTLKFN